MRLSVFLIYLNIFHDCVCHFEACHRVAVLFYFFAVFARVIVDLACDPRGFALS